MAMEWLKQILMPKSSRTTYTPDPIKRSPMECPKCGGEMKIIAFIEEKTLIEKILRHCDIWKNHKQREKFILFMMMLHVSQGLLCRSVGICKE